MNKFFSILFLITFIALLSFGMEQGISNNNNEPVATIITSDEQEFPINNTKELEALQQATTIANFLEFLDENEKIINLPEVTSDQFNKVFPLLKTIHENKFNSHQAHEKLMQQLNRKNSNKQTGIKEGKQEEDEPTTIEYTTEEIVTLFNTADYLDVPQSIDLKKHPHLQPIFDSLPEAIKNKLIEKEFIILPLSNIKSWLTMLKNGL